MAIKTATKTSASNISNLAGMIDSYGELKALIAELEAKKKDCEAAMAELPAGAYEGNLFRLNIIESSREAPDAILKAEFKRVVEEYRETLSRQYLQAHMGETQIRTHKVMARTGKRVMA